MATPGERFDRTSDGEAYKPETRGLDPRKVVVTTGWNVRDMNSPETREHIKTLKLSIVARGVDKPISVRYDKVTGVATLVDGQCRLTACRELWQEGTKVYVPSMRVTGGRGRAPPNRSRRTPASPSLNGRLARDAAASSRWKAGPWRRSPRTSASPCGTSTRPSPCLRCPSKPRR